MTEIGFRHDLKFNAPYKKDSLMIGKLVTNWYLKIIMLLLVLRFTADSQNQQDLVKGNLIQFNDNGAWCWYQDERAVVDLAGGKLVFGSVASGAGVGGSTRNGVIDAVIFNLQSGLPQRYALAQFGCDDHNAPGCFVRPDGKYLAMYAQHYDAYNSRYRIFNGTTWTPEQTFDWTTIPGGTDYTIAYSNLCYLSSEGRLYNFARANHRCPNLLYSTNMGDTWLYGGILATNTSSTYNKGYYRYWSNGVDRIDFIFTEQHPRDTMTSIYHGYIENGKSYRSDGTQTDANIFDTLNIPSFGNFTRVFSDSTMLAGYLMRRCWNTDVVRYADGTIVTIVTARTSQYTGSDANINPEHAYIYCRYNGSSWSYSYLGKAGLKMYSSEADYVGNAAVHPNDPNTIYISSAYDPRDTTLAPDKREIFKGVTTNQGVTWTWTAITQKSARDNFRPIVPNWDNNNTALLWWRGTYSSAQSFNAAVVGIIERSRDSVALMNYVDATPANTFLETGAALTATGPDTGGGISDNLWHWRTGYGNGNSILTSAEIGGENAPALKTAIRVPSAGTYDVWVNFWGTPTTAADWRIKAGLSVGGVQFFRTIASKEVESGDHASPIILTGRGNTFLYQAYVGRVDVAANDSFKVFVDDESIQTGTTGTRVGNTCRTWYDGFSYAKVSRGTVSVSESETVPVEFSLSQNYPNPFNPSTTIKYSLPREAYVDLRVYNLPGQKVATLVNKQMVAGTHSITWTAHNTPSGVYFYKIAVGNYSMTKKMLLLK